MKQLAITGLAIAALVNLVACGNSDTTTLADSSVFVRAQPAALEAEMPLFRMVSSRAAYVPKAVRVPSAQELLDWAQASYPTLFPVTPSRPALQTFATYVYRYYPQFDWLLAVNQADGAVLGLVGVSTAAPRVVPLGSLSGFACAVFPSGCGVATPAVFESASVASGSSEVSAVMKVCDPALPRAAMPRAAALGIAQLLDEREVRQALAVARSLEQSRAYTSTRPADSLGSCGGRITYTSYVHSSGTTTATKQYSNYCSLDSGTGNKQITNGVMSFVNRGTPTASGPITMQFTSQSPDGLLYETRTGAGAIVSSQTYKFTNYVYTPGVPGGTANASSPDRIAMEELVSTNNVTGKAYRETGYLVTTYETADGGDVSTMSGRGYRSNGQYFDVTTTSPVVKSGSGKYTGGQFTFSGAPGSVTVANVVTGSSTLQASVAVNGQAVAGLPACSP